MADWAAFHPFLRSSLVGCPDPVIEQELRESAFEFFRRTRAWVEWLPAITTTSSRQYQLTPPAGAMVHLVQKVTLNGAPVDVVPWVDQESNPDAYPGGSSAAMTADPSQLQLDLVPAPGMRLDVQVVLVPSMESSGVPDRLFRYFANPIAAGAKARLHAIPDTDFYRPDQVALAQGEFEDAIGAEGLRAYRSSTTATPRRRVRFI